MNLNTSLIEHFQFVVDPRIDRTKKHNLVDILIITVCSILSGCDCWTDIVDWADENVDWLNSFLELPNGIPSHDTFGRVFAILNPEQLHVAFFNWVEQVKGGLSEGEIINIDGKFLNATKSFDNSRNALIMVSAWASQTGISLGQLSSRLKKDEGEKKTTEKLLDCIQVKGNIITLDAMGASPNILNKIVDRGGDYVVAIKDNQRKIKLLSQKLMKMNQHLIQTSSTQQKSHGREEKRHYELLPLPQADTCGMNQALDQCLNRFNSVNGLGRVTSSRKQNGKESVMVRYYMSSLENIDEFSKSVREHWSIENNLHWQMDVTFREDEIKAKLGFAAENLAVVRRLALNLLNKETSENRSIRRKRKLCGMRKSYLFKVIFGNTGQ